MSFLSRQTKLSVIYPRMSVEWSSTVIEIYLIDVFHSVIGQECLSLLK